MIMLKKKKKYTCREVAHFFEVDLETVMQRVRIYRERFTFEELEEINKDEFVFTENGVLIISTLLTSPKAIQIHIEIIRSVVMQKEIDIFDLLIETAKTK